MDLGSSPSGSGKTTFVKVQLSESRFPFGSVVPMRVIYSRVSTEKMQGWAVCLLPRYQENCGNLTQSGNLLFLPDLFQLKGWIL